MVCESLPVGCALGVSNTGIISDVIVISTACYRTVIPPDVSVRFWKYHYFRYLLTQSVKSSLANGQYCLPLVFVSSVTPGRTRVVWVSAVATL